MTQQFKKGDKVTVREGATSLAGHPVPAEEVRTVQDVDPGGGMFDVRLNAVGLRPGNWFKSADLIPVHDPLDPSKVTVRKQVHWATDLKRGDVIVSVEAHNAVTVEREEPAPEPEWLAGDVADITVNPHGALRAVRVRAGNFWAADTEEVYSDDDVESVRPLVVIDPAAVDVDALARTASKVYDPSTNGVLAVIRSALAELGVEVP